MSPPSVFIWMPRLMNIHVDKVNAKSIGWIFFLLFSATLLSCSEDFVDKPKSNLPPETYISVFSNNLLNSSTSRQTFNWWGDDPDGIVVGYIYTFDQNAENVSVWDSATPSPGWTFTTERGGTFTLVLTGSDTIYVLRVKAIDDLGDADPTAAERQFPIVNSPPVVEFPVGTDVPDTTYTVASFVWSGSDPDGNDNIQRYEYVLDDTNGVWTNLESQTSAITLASSDGLTEGDHIFYLRAIDIANTSSPTIRMPREEEDVWYVREPKSTFLVVDDHNVNDNTSSFYKNILSQAIGTYDYWDIKRSGGALEPPSSEAFAQTLLLFDRIFWFSDSEPNLPKAQVSIPGFLDNGGKIIMTLSFGRFQSNIGDPLDFSPVDSLGIRINRITRNQNFMTTDFAIQLGFPDLRQSTAIIPDVFALVPKISSQVLYQLPASSGWTGMPPVGLIDANQTFVFFGVPLAGLDSFGNVNALIEKILLEVF